MDRSRRLYELWSWLVPFRAVAETESLAAASELLRVAPSALSRSVKLLETRLEVELFDRRSQRLALNAAGHRLLAAVRTAMRGIDDGIVDVIGEASTPAVRVVCPGELVPLVLACLGDVTSTVRCTVDEPADADAIAALERGVADVALITTLPASAAVATRRLGSLPRAVYASSAASAAVADPRYVVAIDAAGAPRDGFPASARRTIALRVRQGAAVLAAVRAADVVAVLPRAVAQHAGLVAVDAPIAIRPLELWLATRPPLASSHGGVARLADRLATALVGE